MGKQSFINQMSHDPCFRYYEVVFICKLLEISFKICDSHVIKEELKIKNKIK